MWENVSVWQDNVLNYTCKGKKACGRLSLCGRIMSSTTPVKVRRHTCGRPSLCGRIMFSTTPVKVRRHVGDCLCVAG